MKAIRYYGPADIRVETVDPPDCCEGELRVRVDACAVCGTDLKAFKSGNPRIAVPQIMGHEFTGIIEELGAGVTGFDVGQRVVMATSVSCGSCAYCQRGWPNLCLDLSPMGFGYPGGMAEVVTIPARAVTNGHVITVPANVEAVHAALAEPVSCAINCARNSRIQAGDTVVVIGAGPMGIINACVAQQFEAERIILSEVNPERLRQAEAFGFDVLVDSSREDLKERVLAETDGLGSDVVIVAAPAAAPQEEALSLVRKQGTVCLFASLPVGQSALTLDSRLIHYGEIHLVGTSDSTPEDVRMAVDLIAKQALPVKQLASHVLGLDDILEAFDLMQSGKALRVVLTP